MTHKWGPFGYRRRYDTVDSGTRDHITLHTAWWDRVATLTTKDITLVEIHHAWSAFCIQWIVIGTCATMLADVWEGGRRGRDIDQRDINPDNRSNP